MRAVVFHASLDVRLEEVKKPQCPPDGLLVKIEACGVCGTDLKTYRYGNLRIKAPQIMGHEFVGIIKKSYADHKGFNVGDRIVMATSVSCGRCYFCQKGWRNLCDSLSPMGFSYPGGMAEFVAIPARALDNGHVIKVSKTIPSEYAALSEPLSCAVNASENICMQEGDTVVIVGAGPMGLINSEIARAQGAGRIAVIETNSQRREIAQRFKPDLILDPEKNDVVHKVKEFNHGRGADVVIVAAPSTSAHEQALQLVRKKGVLCLFASLPAEKSNIVLDSRLIHYKEIKIVGTSDSTPKHVIRAVELLEQGKIRAELLVTHILSLEEFSEAFRLMESKKSLRVVLRP